MGREVKLGKIEQYDMIINQISKEDAESAVIPCIELGSRTHLGETFSRMPG